MASHRTIVSLGCSPDPDYAFLLPFTALLWRRAGFDPLAIIVGRSRADDGEKKSGALEWATDKNARHTLDALREHRIPTYSVAAVDGYPYATTAQVVRQHAAALVEIADFKGAPSISLAIDENDWMMPGDADLWPLRRAFYQNILSWQHSNSYKAVLTYWNGDNFLGRDRFLRSVAEGRRDQTLPTCHVGMRVRDWREVYQLTPGENLADAVERTLTAWYSKFPRDGFNTWMTDQDVMTYKLCSQPWFPPGRPPDDEGPRAHGEVLFIGRPGQPPRDRLDRDTGHLSNWDRPFDPGRWTDAHVMRKPWTEVEWPRLRRVLAVVLPAQLSWAESYRNEFMRAVSEESP